MRSVIYSAPPRLLTSLCGHPQHPPRTTTPLHPPFFVRAHKMAWFDFSSGEEEQLSYVRLLTEGLAFPEGVGRLAAEAGVALPKVSPEDIARGHRQRTLYHVLELEAKFFQTSLASP